MSNGRERVADAAIVWVHARRAYLASLASHEGWSDEQKKAEHDRDPAAWFAPSNLENAALRELVAAVDALSASQTASSGENHS